MGSAGNRYPTLGRVGADRDGLCGNVRIGHSLGSAEQLYGHRRDCITIPDLTDVHGLIGYIGERCGVYALVYVVAAAVARKLDDGVELAVALVYGSHDDVLGIRVDREVCRTACHLRYGVYEDAVQSVVGNDLVALTVCTVGVLQAARSAVRAHLEVEVGQANLHALEEHRLGGLAGVHR